MMTESQEKAVRALIDSKDKEELEKSILVLTPEISKEKAKRMAEEIAVL